MELTNPQVIKEIKKKFGFEFKKAFGQNFLTSKSTLEDICDAASGADGIIEIGPGFGVLTQQLCDCFEKVVAIELDNRLPEVLQYTLGDKNNFKIINDDCMKIDLKKLIEQEFGYKTVSVAANLPYYITTPILTMLLESGIDFQKIVVMVQKEVALRLTAKAGTKDYGAISVFCDYYADTEIISKVPAACFVPPPKVDSAVVMLTPRKDSKFSVKHEKTFFSVVRSAFSQRRKTLLNCLSSSFPIAKSDMSELLLSVGIEPTRRGETLSKYEFAKVADKIYESVKGV